jgi:hypothetical protein
MKVITEALLGHQIIRLENTERAIQNGQFSETVSIGYTRREQTKQKHSTICGVHRNLWFTVLALPMSSITV